MPRDSPRQVVIVVFDEMELLDAVGPAEVLSAATEAVTAAVTAASGGAKEAYRIRYASADGSDVRSRSGVRIGVDATLATIDEPVDTLLIAGGMTVPEKAAADRALLAGVRRVAERSRRICSVCTGTFILAAAGLLTGRTVTSHWAVCDQLSQQYPDLQVEPDRIFVRDGHLYTSGGVTSGLDLALALVEDDHGAEVARIVAKYLVMFLQRPGGQSQFSAWVEQPIVEDSPIRRLAETVIADPAHDHSVGRMAHRAGMSERQLTRLFADELRVTPARYVERVRVEAAQQLLERSSHSVADVAEMCGFGSAETLRRAFSRVLGVQPSSYRARFRTTSPADNGTGRSPDHRLHRERPQ
ncbi:GlxA family transcriptional regulator [Nocardioides sp. NPDC126508]